jgi:hypothetical protein
VCASATPRAAARSSSARPRTAWGCRPRARPTRQRLRSGPLRAAAALTEHALPGIKTVLKCPGGRRTSGMPQPRTQQSPSAASASGSSCAAARSSHKTPCARARAPRAPRHGAARARGGPASGRAPRRRARPVPEALRRALRGTLRGTLRGAGRGGGGPVADSWARPRRLAGGTPPAEAARSRRDQASECTVGTWVGATVGRGGGEGAGIPQGGRRVF